MREHFNYSEGIVWGGGYEMQKCMTRQCSGGYETQASTAGLKATILFSWNLRSACTDAQMYEPPTIH